jgi:hypothetical protein
MVCRGVSPYTGGSIVGGLRGFKPAENRISHDSGHGRAEQWRLAVTVNQEAFHSENGRTQGHILSFARKGFGWFDGRCLPFNET